MRDGIEIIGPCSKWVEGKGWVTKVSESLIKPYLDYKLKERTLEVYIFLKNIADHPEVFKQDLKVILEVFAKTFNIEVENRL